MKKNKLFLGLGMAFLALSIFQSCADIPDGVKAVQNFQKEKYLGKWYEIARFDYRFEKNIDNATAFYTVNSDGTIKVVNKGFDYKKQKWTSVEGKAKFVGSENEGRLKVSFFGPFYAGYNVVDIDENYQNAMVYGSSRDYIWFLSRNKKMDDATKKKFLAKALKDGYDISKLIWVSQDKN